MHLLHRSELGEYLNMAGLLGTGVEVGVGGGSVAREILKTWKGQRRHLRPFPWATELTGASSYRTQPLAPRGRGVGVRGWKSLGR